ncbi:polyprenyl synthetase family protein [Streptomyces sp. NWU49]|uniref:polyprenyl synthetase family protein n=1 Tax=Streptomyces sp. NWU49 TaxID=2201153 RepID=UPI00215A2AE6|nr:polyprenyl synthetase family protein [Streptomyces sp. NWU49]
MSTTCAAPTTSPAPKPRPCTPPIRETRPRWDSSPAPAAGQTWTPTSATASTRRSPHPSFTCWTIPDAAWRPYVTAAVLCLLGADPEPYRPLTAVTELLHVSALIIDDIQDNSPIRRGRPSVHEVFGTAPAITAGTLGYYTFDALMQRVPQADPSTMLRIYRLYLRDMRAAHAGQALDIAGHHTAFDEAVTTGNAGPLLGQVRMAHRLKTGMLVRSSAEISAIFGGADERQLEAICEYFEAVGIAYQITDDVADLYGLVTAEEHRQGITTRPPAEDLLNGEVTYPVAHAVGLLPATDRQRLRDALRQHSDAGARQASDLLASSGALEACMSEARTLVDEAWDTLHPLLPPPCTRPWSARWAGTPPNAKPTTSSKNRDAPDDSKLEQATQCRYGHHRLPRRPGADVSRPHRHLRSARRDPPP